MASAFWGGFADTLLQERQQNDAAEREKKKLLFLKSLETSTRIEQRDGRWVEVTIDGLGKEKGIRPLSENERATQVARQQKEQAEASKAASDASLSEFNASHAQQKFNADLADTQSNIDYRNQSLVNERARIGLEGRRVGLDEARSAVELDAAKKMKDRQAGKYTYQDVYSALSNDPDIVDIVRLNGRTAAAALQQAATSVANSPVKNFDAAIAAAKNSLLSRFGSTVYQIKHPPKGLDTMGTTLVK